MSNDQDDKSAGAELKEGLTHLFSAAKKVIRRAEPTLNRSLDDAERVFGKIGRGGEAVAQEVTREVAGIAVRLADRLRAVADRADGNVPDERTPPEPPSAEGGEPPAVEPGTASVKRPDEEGSGGHDPH